MIKAGKYIIINVLTNCKVFAKSVLITKIGLLHTVVVGGLFS